jgi:two-component system, NarL family, sensor kinase
VNSSRSASSQKFKNTSDIDGINLLILNGREHKAISILKEKALLYNANGNFESLVQSYLYIGDAFLSLRDMQGAFENYQLSIKLAKEKKCYEKLGVAHLALAFYYHENKFFEKAWQQISKAEFLAKKHKSEMLLRSVFSQKGIYFRRKKDIQSAVHFNELAYNLCLKSGSPNDKFDYSINLSTSYIYAKRYKDAIQVLKHALLINEIDVKSQLNEANANSSIGWVHMLLGNENLSIRHTQKAVDLSMKVKNEHMIRVSTRNLAQIFKRFNRLSEAYDANLLFVNYFEKGIKQQRELDVAELIKGYEIKLKEEQIAKINSKRKQEKALLQSQLTASRFIVFTVITFLFLVLIAAFFYYKRLKERSKINEQLMLKTQESQAQRHYMELQEKERSRIALELHDGLGSLLSSVKFRLESFSFSEKSERLTPILNDISQACAEVRTVSHNLNSFSLSLSKFDDLLRYTVSTFESFDRKIDFHSDLDGSVELNNDVKQHILRIIQELLNNAVKHSFSTEIIVGVLIENESIFLQVEDNGIGFKTNENLDGIGLKNIEMRVQILGGQLEVFSKEGKYTQVSIQIPIVNSMQHV